MRKVSARRVALFGVVVLVATLLTGCVPPFFQADFRVMQEFDEEVAGWALDTAGEVLVECSYSRSLGADYQYFLLLRGDEAWEAVQERFSQADFEINAN